MKKNTVIAALAASLLFLAAPARAYEAFTGPVGLLLNNEAKTYKGYTLITPNTSKQVFLIDMQGNMVNKWTSEYPGMYSELLPNGNILRHSRLPGGASDFGGECGLLEEFDWSGKKVWEYKFMSDQAVTHHAFDRMPNGNTMILVWENKTFDEAVAKGRDPKKPGNTMSAEGQRNATSVDKPITGVWVDYVMEVDPAGKIVWEWHPWDHIGTGPDQLDINFFLSSRLGRFYSGADWTHFNSVRYNPQTDQVLISSRNFGEIFIIDKKTGKMVYRWGNPGTHGQGKLPFAYGEPGDQKLFGPHDANWLPNGNISVFDNGTNRPIGAYSRVVELDPKEGRVVWEFMSKRNDRAANSFYSAYQSAAQLLPNGAYLVTATLHGHIFEVTREKEVVWEYQNPMSNDKTYCSVEDMPMTFMVHRAFRYGPDYPGLQGKDLSPKGPMAQGCPDWVDLLKINRLTPPPPAPK